MILRSALLLLLLSSSQVLADLPVVERVMVEMSDGVRLATDVYYPQEGDGPWPVMLYRTPYGIVADHVGYFANSGWVAVCQDTRGRFDSEGEDLVFMADGWGPEHQDGLDAVRWILDQPWSDDRIATTGGSARGITQNMLAGALPPSLKCQFVVVAPADMYTHAIFPGGAFRERDIVAWLAGNGSSHFMDSLVVHPNYDEFWTWCDTSTRDSLITIPTYQFGGWFDLFCEGTIDKFCGLQQNGAPGARGDQKLLIGPWTHGGASGQLDYPANAGVEGAYALIGSETEWYDYWVHEIPNGIMDKPPIAYYLMGDVDEPAAPGNEWRTATDWPPPAIELDAYLHEGGILDLTPPVSGEAPDSYLYDPTDPVISIGGSNLVGDAGPYDQRPVEGRDDVILFDSAILDEPLEIVGPVTMTLFASSSCLDTDFTAKLCDVYPDGRSMLVCDGIIRARHRISPANEDPLVPGEITEFHIRLGETALVFNMGHRVRLAISSSNWDRFDLNPNTGAPWGDWTQYQVAENVIYHDTDHPSRLHLRLGGVATPVAEGPANHASIHLGGVFPNPFNPSCEISFSLNRETSLKVSIFDTGGRRIRSLAEGPFTTGEHRLVWNGLGDRGQVMASGIYLLSIDAGHDKRSAKLLLLK